MFKLHYILIKQNIILKMQLMISKYISIIEQIVICLSLFEDKSIIISRYRSLIEEHTVYEKSLSTLPIIYKFLNNRAI